MEFSEYMNICLKMCIYYTVTYLQEKHTCLRLFCGLIKLAKYWKCAYMNKNERLRGYLVVSQHFICDKDCEVGKNVVGNSARGHC